MEGGARGPRPWVGVGEGTAHAGGWGDKRAAVGRRPHYFPRTPVTCTVCCGSRRVVAPHAPPEHMKDCLVGLTMVGVLMMGLLGTAAAFPGYWPQRQDPYLLQADAGDHVFKRGFWDKRTEMRHNPTDVMADYPSQGTEGRLTEKRGFGSMMPVYLTHLYRPEQPVLPSSALLSSTRLGWERPKTSSSSQG